MQGYIVSFAFVVLIVIVFLRILQLKKQGIPVMNFGNIDKTDFIIPPFAIVYLYLVLAAAFHLPTISRQVFFQSERLAWLGVLLCLADLVIVGWSLISFGRSFRVGIDQDHPDQFVTTGIFAFSRNPIYVGFGLMLLGQFLVFPNWILLLYMVVGFWLLNRQVLREEDYLKEKFGAEFSAYSQRVRRYL